MNALALLKLLPPNVTPDMLDVNFWLARMGDVDRVMLSPEDIAAFNRRVHALLEIPAFHDLPDALSAEEVRRQIAAYQKPSKPRYGGLGQRLDDAYFEAQLANATPPLPDGVAVQFGLVTERTQVRYFPTMDIATAEPYDFAFDLFQETAIDLGWPAAVIAASRDGEWYFCLTPLYWGWARRDHVALAPRAVVAEYSMAESFVVTTAPRGLVALAHGGGVAPQMGTRLPLIGKTEQTYRVRVPVRNPDGTLHLSEGVIDKAAHQFSLGYQPFTLRTLFDHAFSLLGEPYAWGCYRMGLFGRDCSRYVKDTHAVSGVILPRNGDQQGQVGLALARFTPEMSANERQALLVGQVSPGAILVTPTHVMLYLGDLDGEPYIIHDTAAKPQSSVLVSDMSSGRGGPRGSLLEQLTVAVKVGLA